MGGKRLPQIHQAWREQHWRAPALTEDFDHNETRLVLSMESLLPDEVVADLDARFADRFGALPEAKRSALVTAAAEGQVTNGRLQQVLDLHPRDLTTLLGDLVRDGFLVPHGERAGRWYTLGSDQRSEQSSEQRSERRSEHSPTKGSPREEVEAAILALCRDEFVDLPALAAALGRAASTVRTHYLRPLLDSGRLVLRHPDKPNHPHQAYRATPTEAPDER